MPKPAVAAATIAAAMLAVAPAVLPGGGASAAPAPAPAPGEALTRTLELRGSREAMEQGLVPAPRPLTAAEMRNARAADVALRYLGTPYSYGGSSPAGFDCSGLVSYAYARVGVSMAHNTNAIWGAFPKVDRADLQVGDMVFFSGLGHMGIYVGDGRYVHAPHSGEVVEVAPMAERDDYGGSRARGVAGRIRLPRVSEGWMETGASDETLVRDARGGSRDAAGALFDRHWRAVWRASFAIARHHQVAEDCAQDAFVRAFAGLDGYRGPSFRAWVSRIAVNQTLNHLRRDRRLTDLEDRPGDDEMPAPDAALGRAVAALPDERRALVVLRYWLGYTPAEIAPIVGLPVGTVHSRLARALDQLRDALEVGDAGRP